MTSPPENSLEITYVLTEHVSRGYGYDIFDNGKKIISQPYIPGIVGEKTFADQQDAAKVAEFVIKKIEKGQFPPSVTGRELDSLLGAQSPSLKGS